MNVLHVVTPASWVIPHSVPAGGLVMAMQALSGETYLERRKRERRELYEQQMIEW